AGVFDPGVPCASDTKRDAQARGNPRGPSLALRVSVVAHPGSQTPATVGALLTVTNRTTGQMLRVAHAVLLTKLPAQRWLVGGLHVLDVEDFLAGADFALGMAVAIDAPFHQQRRRLVGQGHLVDLPVA